MEELDIPTSNLVAKDPQQDQHGQSNSFDPSPLLARSAMVSTAVGDTGRLSTSTASPSSPDLSSFRNGNETFPPEQTPSEGMARIREHYRTTGLSESATRILLSSWSEATQKRYSGPWNAWASWCNKRSLCSFTAPVDCILSFLAELSDQDNLAYRTIGVYRSAISQIHDPIGTVSVGELPIVSRFMKGIFRLNPPKPKLCTTWPVRDVLSFIRTQKPVTGPSLKDLSWRLVLLLALTSAARAHEIATLDMDFLTEKEDSWEFSLVVHVKQSRPNHPSRRIYLPAFPEDTNLCVVTTLKEYRARTAKYCRSSRLLLAIVAPHAPITAQTVSRWLRNALGLAGITPEYIGHSTRSVSTSAVAESGIPLEVIIEAADWASAETFHRFYHGPSTKGTFANTVLSG